MGYSLRSRFFAMLRMTASIQTCHTEASLFVILNNVKDLQDMNIYRYETAYSGSAWKPTPTMPENSDQVSGEQIVRAILWGQDSSLKLRMTASIQTCHPEASLFVILNNVKDLRDMNIYRYETVYTGSAWKPTPTNVSVFICLSGKVYAFPDDIKKPVSPPVFLYKHY